MPDKIIGRRLELTERSQVRVRIKTVMHLVGKQTLLVLCELLSGRIVDNDVLHCPARSLRWRVRSLEGQEITETVPPGNCGAVLLDPVGHDEEPHVDDILAGAGA